MIRLATAADADGLAELARRAAEAAASAPVDPDFPGFAEPTEAPSVDGYDAATAELGPDAQARFAAEAIDAADVPVYGFFTSALSEVAIASSTGLEAEQQMTDATTLVVAADNGCSGYAEATSWRAGAIDPASVAREASEKAARTNGAKEIEPNSYAAVLEPYAFADLLQYFSYDSLGALGLLEERGYFAGRLGQRVFDERITILDDSLDPRGLPKAFDFEGSPKQRVELVTDGVARGVVWDRTTAKRAGNGTATTGHALPPGFSDFGPLPSALAVAPGDAESTAELVERVGDGLYITRLHYLGVVQPREGVITGMTRDGTFQDRGAARQPPVHRFLSGALERRARANARAGADLCEQLLRRAVSVRHARPGARDEAVQHHGRRQRARDLAAYRHAHIVDVAKNVLVPTAQPG